MEKRRFVERNLHEVSAPLMDSVAPSYEYIPGCFIAYGIEVDPPALRMNLGLSNSSINPIHAPTLRATFPRYIVVNRNGSVNEMEASSRSFNPLAIFHEMKSVYIALRCLAPTYTT